MAAETLVRAVVFIVGLNSSLRVVSDYGYTRTYVCVYVYAIMCLSFC